MRDKAGRIRTCPMTENGMDRRAGVVLVDNSGTLYASDAVLRTFQYLPGLWPLVARLAVIPRRWREAAYHFVARRRYAWFGCQTCRANESPEAAQNIAG